MKDYELVCVIRPDLSKEGYEEIKEKMSSVISSNEGKVKSWDVWKEKTKLAYSLRSHSADKTEYDEAVYTLAEYSLPGDKVGFLERALDLEERILRYLALSKSH